MQGGRNQFQSPSSLVRSGTEMKAEMKARILTRQKASSPRGAQLMSLSPSKIRNIFGVSRDDANKFMRLAANNRQTQNTFGVAEEEVQKMIKTLATAGNIHRVDRIDDPITWQPEGDTDIITTSQHKWRIVHENGKPNYYKYIAIDNLAVKESKSSNHNFLFFVDKNGRKRRRRVVATFNGQVYPCVTENALTQWASHQTSTKQVETLNDEEVAAQIRRLLNMKPRQRVTRPRTTTPAAPNDKVHFTADQLTLNCFNELKNSGKLVANTTDWRVIADPEKLRRKGTHLGMYHYSDERDAENPKHSRFRRGNVIEYKHDGKKIKLHLHDDEHKLLSKHLKHREEWELVNNLKKQIIAKNPNQKQLTTEVVYQDITRAYYNNDGPWMEHGNHHFHAPSYIPDSFASQLFEILSREWNRRGHYIEEIKRYNTQKEETTNQVGFNAPRDEDDVLKRHQELKTRFQITDADVAPKKDN